MYAFRIFKFITGLLPRYVFPNKNRLLNNWPFFTYGFWMASFFNTDSTSLVTSKDSLADIFGLCGTFSWNVSKIKSIFRPDTHSKILGFLSIFHSVLQNIATLLLEKNCWLLHWEISFVPLGVLLCFLLAEECFCSRKLPICCIFYQGIVGFYTGNGTFRKYGESPLSCFENEGPLLKDRLFCSGRLRREISLHSFLNLLPDFP